MSKPHRLDQLLGSLGYGSRREAQGIVLRGQVTVQGEVVTDFDRKVLASEVLVKGQPLEAPEGLLALFHKPLDAVCTRSEGEGIRIYDLLPKSWSKRNPPVTSIGRLDKDTSGLLLITDQGGLVQRYTSPKSDIAKVYEVEVDKPLEDKLIDVFAEGTLLLESESKPCLPAALEIVSERQARLTITEGRYHQVRRMFASQGWFVEKLHRTQFGEHHLGDLPVGKWLVL
jgi:16S rRNA pseudouridine516 synthase